ncbi:MAG: cobalt transporter CbiM [Dehalococcoidia bacterium]|nr:cobalt transporter CbiM [Dehalococcoidia bacterium]
MHIPDGYLSPATAVVMYGAAIPFWYVASKRVQRSLSSKMVPILSVLSASAFTIQMFNIPLPGGTTGHAVGAALMAIILGPWAAVLGITVALVIQAFFFGDGGIWAIGANAFNMAIVGSFVSYYAYRFLAGNSQVVSRRRVVAAALGSYLAINVSALFTSVELGLQPLLFKAADGTPLYAPYGLAQSIPAVMAGHLLVAGVAEAAITAFVIAYLQKANEPLLTVLTGRIGVGHSYRWLWAGLAAMILLTPLGLMATGTAWGEWNSADLLLAIGFVPKGMVALENVWNAPLSDYEVAGLGLTTGYMVSGLLGVVAIGLSMFMIGKWLARGET